jgi:hypothetical protein
MRDEHAEIEFAAVVAAKLGVFRTSDSLAALVAARVALWLA